MIRRWIWSLLLPAVVVPAAFRGTPAVANRARHEIRQHLAAEGTRSPPPAPARRSPTAVVRAPSQLPGRNEVGSALEQMLEVTPAVADDIARRLAERDREAERTDEEQRPALDERVDREIEAFLFGESLNLYWSMRADGRIAGTAP